MRIKILLLFIFTACIIQECRGQYTRVWETPYPSLPEGSLYNITEGLPGFMYAVGITYTPATKNDVNFLKIDSSGNVIWQYVYNSPDSLDDYSSTVLSDDGGSVYTVALMLLDTSAGHGNSDIRTLKLNDSGGLEWQRQYDSQQHGDENPVMARLSSNADLLVTGKDYHQVLGTHTFLIKYDSAGTLSWEQSYPLSEPITMVLDDDNNSHLLLFTDSLRVVKFDTGGNVLWNTGIADNVFSNLSYMAIDQNNEVLVLGSIASPLFPSSHISIARLDTAGTIKWVKHFEALASQSLYDMRLDSQGNVYVGSTGYSLSNQHLLALQKFNVQGDSLWTAIYNPGLLYPYCILWDMQLINDEKIVVNAQANSFDGWNDGSDQFTLVTDSSGALLYQDIYDQGVGNEVFYSIGIDNALSIYLTGSVSDTLLGTSSAYIVKYQDVTLHTNIQTVPVRFKLYPNPTEGPLSLMLFGLFDADTKLEVFDYTGKKVYSRITSVSSGNNPYSLNLGGVSPGLYLVKLTGNDFEATERILLIK